VKFYFHQVWKEDGRDYANRLDFNNVADARKAHKSASDFMWSKPGYSWEAITDLTWEDDHRSAPIQQGTTRKYRINVTDEPQQSPCPLEVKKQLAAMIGKQND
jgi:hypothetical protein